LLTDLEGDGQGEVLAGSTSGQVYALADEGQVLWDLDLGEPVWALSAGDVDSDAQGEIVAGTWEPIQSRGGGQVHLLDGAQLVWSALIGGGIINSVAVADLDGDEQPEIMVGSGQTEGQVALLSGGGEVVWEREFDESVTAVTGADGGQVVVGTKSGRIYRLMTDGSLADQHELGARVLSLDGGRALTADGRLYRVDDDEPTLVRDLGEIPKTAQLRAGYVAMLIGEQDVSLVAGDGSIWKGTVDGPAFGIAAADLNGDGEIEIAVSTEERVHFLGSALNQPPLITEPDVVDTRAGYAYSVNVNDPDGDVVTVVLEIWDPSAGVWVAQPAQSLAHGQGPSRLAWDVPDPFDTWDSGRESYFRLRYDDGVTHGTTAEILGPIAIPTEPWYLYYGWRAGLGALVLLTLTLNLLLHRCQCGSLGLWPFGRRGRGAAQGARDRPGWDIGGTGNPGSQ
jgi:outer membrane protein assembly factor BamB